MDKRQFAIGFAVLFIILIIYTGINNDRIVKLVSSMKMPESILVYLLTRVDFLLIFLTLFLSRISTLTREFFAGIALIWAFDIIGLPKLPREAMPTDLSFLANSDAIFMTKLISFTKLDYSIAWNIYYIVFPILLTLLTIYLLGFWRLGRRLNGG